MKILFVQTNYDPFLFTFYQKTKNWQKLSYKKLKLKWSEEWFGVSNFYSKYLKTCGWVGENVVINDWNIQSKWAHDHELNVTRKEISFLKFIPPSIRNFLGLSGWMKKIFFEQLNFYKPNVVYVFDLSIFSTTDIKKIKRVAKLVVGQIAYPLPINKRPLFEYNLIISSFPHYVKMFKQWGIESKYLKLAVDSEIPKKIRLKKRIYDVTFVGGLIPYHKKGNLALSKLATEVKVDIWGYGEKTLPLRSPIKKNFHGQAWGRKMYEIFAQSKIVINRHIDIAKDFANNLRMFEATAMGALLITDHKKNMNEFFEVGREVVTYINPDDLIQKVKYYLAHLKEAEKIAKAGQKRTLKEHTYRLRMKELDGILRKYL